MAVITTFSILLERVVVMTHPGRLMEMNTKSKSAGLPQLLVALYVSSYLSEAQANGTPG